MVLLYMLLCLLPSDQQLRQLQAAGSAVQQHLQEAAAATEPLEAAAGDEFQVSETWPGCAALYGSCHVLSKHCRRDTRYVPMLAPPCQQCS
jgi:hypothetical protein